MYTYSILPDWDIARLCEGEGMISPFVGSKIRRDGDRPIISRGLSSFGYDISAAQEAKVFVPYPGARINPKRFDPRMLVEPEWTTDDDGTWFELPPHAFALMRTVEYFRMPSNVLAVCMGKSTLARCGLILNTTPFEPGWCGFVTLEISNTSHVPAQIFANEGIGQVLFFRGMEPDNGYGREGKYQNQNDGITLPKV